MTQKRVIVVGAGAWGGWSAYMLQQAGYEVTLIDKNGPGNTLSGSGGSTRIIRMAYAGSQTYIDMVGRAFDLWDHYCNTWQENLLHKQQALWLFRGVPTDFATASRPIMKAKGCELEEKPLGWVQEKYPQLNLEDITSAFWEPKAGYLEAARACQVVVGKFIASGGTYIRDEVVGIMGNERIDYVLTKSGKQLEADEFVLAAGPWMKALIPELKSLIKVTRHEVYYFEAPAGYDRSDLPIWLEFREGNQMFYGIPDHFNQGFKLAYDQRNYWLDPDKDDRALNPEILNHMQEIVVNRFPALQGARVVKHHTCVYESTADGDYIMDRVPGFSNALMLCGSSGHGFKMGPAIGEMVKDYLQNQKAFPTDLAFDRFAKGSIIKTPYQVLAKG